MKKTNMGMMTATVSLMLLISSCGNNENVSSSNNESMNSETEMTKTTSAVTDTDTQSEMERGKLNQMAIRRGIMDERVLDQSKRLDQMLNQFTRVMRDEQMTL
ncbi:ABC-type enterochelin transport system substrate-binding protein [Paenibacillus sp. DS2015]|uniref:aspartyl-phosphate phosphatase Spo0E family protein n=1 Tax=Paenibacillus sp. DS2015 TaxID=3373917 RepID=UPI003D253E88